MKQRLFCLLLMLIVFATGNAQKYTTANVKLRQGPGISYGVISSLPTGTYVTIDEDCDCEWIPVSYSGKIGYINGRYLSNKKPLLKQNKVRNTLSKSYRTTRNNVKSTGRRYKKNTKYNSQPVGVTALCNDGTYSYSQSRRGTCSHHGGVRVWY